MHALFTIHITQHGVYSCAPCKAFWLPEENELMAFGSRFLKVNLDVDQQAYDEKIYLEQYLTVYMS